MVRVSTGEGHWLLLPFSLFPYPPKLKKVGTFGCQRPAQSGFPRHVTFAEIQHCSSEGLFEGKGQMSVGMVPWLRVGPEQEALISSLADPHPHPPCGVLDRACGQAVFAFPRLETK